MSEIRTVFFDVGGVCLTNGWDHVAREAAAQHFDYAYDEVERRHQKVFEDFERGRLSLDAYLDQTVFFKSRPFSREEFIARMESNSKAKDDSIAVLERLHTSCDAFLATINNESYELNAYRIEKFQLKRYFTAFFSSCFLNARKPDTTIFQTAMAVTQCAPHECFFVDDREENVEGAQRLGMQAHLFAGPGPLKSKLRELDLLT